MRIGLVLGAGGTRGWGFHLGVLAALLDQTAWSGDRAAVIVGTSAGAGVGSLLRAGMAPTELLVRMHEPPPERVRRHMETEGPVAGRPRRLRPQAPGLMRQVARPLVAVSGLLPAGRMPTAPMGAWSRELHGTRWPSRPLWINAVRLSDGRRVVFGRDDDVAWPDVATAVEASCAVPSVFAPVGHGGERYVDGGVHSPTNADLLARPELELDLVLVSSPMSASGAVAPFARQRLFHRTLDSEAEALEQAGIPVVRLEPASDVLAAMVGVGSDRLRMIEVVNITRESVGRHLASDRVADRVELLRAAAPAAGTAAGTAAAPAGASAGDQAIMAPSTTNSSPEQ